MIPGRRQTNDRTFWVALGGATLLHAALIFGAGRSPPRHMGEPEGLLEAISVDLVDPDALAGHSTPMQDANEQGPADSPMLPARPKETEPRTQSAAADPSRVAPDRAKAPTVDDMSPGPFSPPEEAQQDRGGTAGAKTNKRKPSQLDLSLPSTLFKPPAAAGGSNSAMVRPPGITRSGENDDFGRGVLKALRKTMPLHENIYGRVTVRIFLSGNGDLVDLQLVKGSGNAHLDQIVVFSARQAVYPLPPQGATAVDRTFLVTYIYN